MYRKFALITICGLLASCSLFSPEDKESNTWPTIEECDTIGVVDSFENGGSMQTTAFGVANDHGRLYALSMKHLFWVNDSGKFEAAPNQQWQYRGGPMENGPFFIDYADGWKPQFIWYEDSVLITDDDAEIWTLSKGLPTINWWWGGMIAGGNSNRVIALFESSQKTLFYNRNSSVDWGELNANGELRLHPVIETVEDQSWYVCMLHRSMPFAIGDTIYSDSCGHSYYTVNRNTVEVAHHPSPMADTNVVYFFPNAGRLCAMHPTGAYCRNESTGSWAELEFGSSFKAYLSERDGREILVNGFIESDSVTILSLATGSNIALVQNGKIVMRKISRADSQGDGPVNNMTIWNNQFVFTGNSGYILSLPLDEVLAWHD